MKYYLAINGQPEGPFTVEQLALRQITPDMYVWNETMTEWVPAGNVAEIASVLFTPAKPQMPAVPGANTYQSAPQAAPAYQTAPQPTYAPGVNMNGCYEPCPKTWLVESILATLFCCLPFGIVGIIKASNVRSFYDRGDIAGANEQSKSAKKWTMLALISGLVISVLYIVFWVVLVILGANV